ncbi:hypothetical protein RF11_09678 [Thelohanellus kitauei]|uniref:Uncharacterized protein n=1 Tax=Thelohanellus kitauei TaxID=669202 RepID=A0A0C2N201_THEKT|nr:hypothetical protein RF11_09678 [Thelohanellus kitauei]
MLIIFILFFVSGYELHTPKMTNWFKKFKYSVLLCEKKFDWIICDISEGINLVNVTVTHLDEDIYHLDERDREALLQAIIHKFYKDCESQNRCFLDLSRVPNIDYEKCVRILFECRQMSGMR